MASILSNFDTIDPSEVFIGEEYLPDDEGTLIYGDEVAFGEYQPTDDDDDMYEPDVFEYDD